MTPIGKRKPKCKLTVEDNNVLGNAFVIMARVIEALKNAGQGHLIEEYRVRATSCGDFESLLRVSREFVDDNGEEN